jgi:hypothetical protein
MPELPRWSAAQVLALAPDPSARLAGQGLGTPARWREIGCAAEPATVWGLYHGSGKKPYQTCVDLAAPAYLCTCPSRKSPCKHALGLLLLWSAGGMGVAEPPAWVTEWQAARLHGEAEARPRRPTNPATTAASRERRGKRVEAGLAELERWLTDQVRQGLASTSQAGYGHWDTMAARLVDAQAPAVAGAVRRLAGVASQPDRLLAELGLLWLLVRSYQRVDALPSNLAATVRTRIGFPVPTEEVLAGPRVRDEWAVVGVRDEVDERLTVRRVWLRGAATGQPALVLTFAPAGTYLPPDLLLGTSVEAGLCFYPGAQPLRAIVAERHGEPRLVDRPDGSSTVAEALAEYAAALAAEPWLERWPLVLRDVVPVPADGGWRLRDRTGAAVRLDLAWPWPLVAAAGAQPCTVSGEWSTAGLRPLAAWSDEALVAL